MGTKIAFDFANTLQTNRNFSVHSCHATGVKKGFIKREARRLLRIPLKPLLRKISKNFENRPIESGYPASIVRKYLYEVKLVDRKTAP